jgi:hypothetical protein
MSAAGGLRPPHRVHAYWVCPISCRDRMEYMTVEHAVPEMNETLIGSAGALTGKSPQPRPESEPGFEADQGRR